MLQKFLFFSYNVQFGQSPDVATHEHAVNMNTCPIDISVHIWIKPSEIHFVIFGVMALRWTAPNVTPCLGSADNLTSVFANVSQRAIAAKLRRERYTCTTRREITDAFAWMEQLLELQGRASWLDFDKLLDNTRAPLCFTHNKPARIIPSLRAFDIAFGYFINGNKRFRKSAVLQYDNFVARYWAVFIHAM